MSTVIINDVDFDELPWADDVTGGRYLQARDVARDRVDLRALIERYAGRKLTPVAEGSAYKVACFLPSGVPGFRGTCAEQDASAGHPAENLSVMRATDGSHWRWRCFSCGRGQTRDGSRPGDVVDLVTHAEGMHINEGNSGSLKALRHALRLVGEDHVLDGLASPRSGSAEIDFSLVATERPAAARKTTVPLNVALALNKRAREHWQENLKAPDAEATNARTYLATRGVTPEQIERYAIGFARDKFADLTKHIPPQHSAAAQALGLAKLHATGNVGDGQRNRVVFPYCYPARSNNRPIGTYGFAGRTLAGVDPHTADTIPDFAHYNGHPPPKWHNSKNVDGVWSKAADLVGVWQARARIRETGRAVFNEGSLDMLAFDRIGAAALAMVSKEFTLAYARLACDLGISEAVYATDGDAAGRKAVPKFVGNMIAAGYPIEALGVIDSDDGRDPATTEPDTLARRWQNPTPALEHIITALETGTLAHDDLRPLLAAAPWLAPKFGLAFKAGTNAAGTVGFAYAIVVRALIETPALAQHLAANEAAELLACAPEWPRVRALAFGDRSEPESLPQDVRRAWLRMRVQQLHDAVKAYESTPTPSDRAQILAHLTRGAELRKAKREAEKLLIATNALYR